MEFKKVKEILIKVLVLNWLVALVKILIGISSGSLSIMIDGFHALFDGASNILGLLGVKLSEQPRDPEHPYGHRKFEALAALGIAFMIGIVGYEFLKSSITRILNPTLPEITLIYFGVIGGCLIVDFLVWRYENRWGKKLKSTVLIADSLHTKTHLFITPAVMVGMVAMKFGYGIVDPIVTMLVILMLGKLAFEAIRETAVILCDQAFLDIREIQKIVKKFPEIKSSHQIRTRGDVHHIFLDMHISLDPKLSLKEAHQISKLLKDKISKEIPQIKDVVIHVEPWGKECECR